MTRPCNRIQHVCPPVRSAHDASADFVRPARAPAHRSPARLPDRRPRHCAFGRSRSSVASTTRGMSRKPMRRSRKACTAISLAALRTVGASPPDRMQSMARLRQRKRSCAGALEHQLAHARPDRAAATAKQCGAARPAHGRWACACRAPTDAPWWCRPRTTPGNARWIADAPPRPAFPAAARTGNAPRSVPGPCSSRWRCRREILRAHRPVGMGDRLLHRGAAHALQRPFAERPARGGDGDHLDFAGIAAIQHLEDGVVLGIHRDDRGAGSLDARRGTPRPPPPRIPCWPAPRSRRAGWRPAPARSPPRP